MTTATKNGVTLDGKFASWRDVIAAAFQADAELSPSYLSILADHADELRVAITTERDGGEPTWYWSQVTLYWPTADGYHDDAAVVCWTSRDARKFATALECRAAAKGWLASMGLTAIPNR